MIIATLFPFYWMLRTALSTTKSLFSDPASLLPVDPTLGAFKRVLGLSTPEEAHRRRAVPGRRSTSCSTCATRSSTPP